MQEEEIMQLFRDTVLVAVKLVGPPLGVALVIGIAMSLVQAVTQINEQTMVFLPKVVAICATMALLGSFMMSTLGGFTRSVMQRIVSMGAS